MKVLLYGNCQLTIGLYSYLKNNTQLNLDIDRWTSYIYIREKLNLDLEKLLNYDIFIYQPVNLSYGIYSSNNLISLLNKKCIKIGIPFIYIDSFFPLISKNDAHEIDGGDGYNNGKILNENVIIDLKKYNTKQEIISLYKDNKINFNYEKRFLENINRMKEKEKICDVKIVDFILENYKNHKLIHLHVHPDKKILDHITNQVFNLLGIKEYNLLSNQKINHDENFNKIFSGEGKGYPYHQTAIDHFNFKFESDEIAQNYYLDLINIILDLN